MARKVTDGPVRNKQRTKANIIAALGKILKKKRLFRIKHQQGC